jgi:signal transduction histidine kinase
VYDDAYFERRARIGRVHVQIELDQRYMFGAMNLVRSGLHAALAKLDIDGDERRRGHASIDRICDVELAIMLETYRERYVERQRANERLATIGQLAASIGHELRNPLAVMETSIHLLRRKVPERDAQRHFERIARQITLSAGIIDDLLALARDRPPRRELVSLAELCEDARRAVPVPANVEIVLDVPSDMPFSWLDRGQFRQVIVNVLSNAVDAITGHDKGSRVCLDARIEDGALVLQVTDDGPGFAPEVRASLFTPLTTTRTTGIGLGLALCARIVEKHGGSIEAHDPEGGGARIVIRVPDAAQRVE